jgi:hypothetical protein
LHQPRCTRLSGVHRTMFGAQAGASGEQAALGKIEHVVAIILRTFRCASRALGQHSTTRSADTTCARPTVTRLHQAVRCATGLSSVPWDQRLAMVGFTKQGRESHTFHCPVGHRTVRCVHGQKAIRAFLMEEQRLLWPLGAIKEAPRRLYQYTKLPLNILQHRDITSTPLLR